MRQHPIYSFFLCSHSRYAVFIIARAYLISSCLLFAFCAFIFTSSILWLVRDHRGVFQWPFLVMITLIYLDLPCYCSVRRHWPSRDSLAAAIRGCHSCHPGFYDLSFDNQTFARNVAIKYVILFIFAMDVYRLLQFIRCTGGASLNIMPVCALSAAENLAVVSIGRIIISAFCIIRIPSINFYVIR